MTTQLSDKTIAAKSDAARTPAGAASYAALVLGVLSLLLFSPLALVGIFCATSAQRERQGLAGVGIALNCVGIVLAFVALTLLATS